MSSTTSSNTNNTDNGISLVEDSGEAVVEGDRLSISSLSSLSTTGGSATDTDNECEGARQSGLTGEGEALEANRGSRRSSLVEEELDELVASDQIPHEEDLLYAKTQGVAVSRLVLFSCVLFTVPLMLMYLTYRFIFIGYNLRTHYNLTHDRAILYAGIVAAATVYAILALFAWIAYRDEHKLARQVEGIDGTNKKQE